MMADPRTWIVRVIRRWHQDNRGEYLLQFVLIFPLLIVMTGLVIDGGYMYQQYRLAETTVEAAAQAASHAIDVQHFRETDEVILDGALAPAIASQFVNLNKGKNLKQVQIAVAPRLITVQGTAEIPTIFFRIFGINSLTVNVVGRGYPAYGINVEGQ